VAVKWVAQSELTQVVRWDEWLDHFEAETLAALTADWMENLVEKTVVWKVFWTVVWMVVWTVAWTVAMLGQ